MNPLLVFLNKLGADIAERTYEHVYLTVSAMAIAVAIAVPLGIVLAHSRRAKTVTAILGGVAVIQTVPSLALVALIVIFFAIVRAVVPLPFHLPSIGILPALVALVLYALLPILRNTFTSIRQVDPAVIEVAVGMGMTRRQVLFSVELPLALPVIMAGIRIATVWTVGIATLCTFIGAGGLGDLIYRGLQSIQVDYLIAGTVPAALLAIVLDGLLAFGERWLTPDGPWCRISLRRRLWTAAGCVASIGAALALVHVTLSFSSARRGQHFQTGRVPPLKAAFDAEFFTRPDGYPAVCQDYGFSFPDEPQQMDVGLMYKAVSDGDVDVIDAFATDGRIKAFDLVVLRDDRNFFPPYQAAPLVRCDTLEKYPELKQTLDLLAGRLPDAVMQQLNYSVDEEGNKPRDVAVAFLEQERLLGTEERRDGQDSQTIRIGGKPFSEQEILGEIMAVLIESRTGLRVERRLNLGGTMLCFDAIRSGDIDLYPEYTGTGLVSILKREVLTDADESYQVVKSAFSQQYDLRLLKPFGFNNTYTLAMRREQAEQLQIETVSDLAKSLTGR